MNDIMVDIETLGTKNNSVITQIGACFFDRNTGEVGETLLVNIQIQDCLNYGLKINGDTLKWWIEKANLISWLTSPVELTKALSMFREFCHKNKKASIWSHATFDMPLLENAYDIIGEKFPLPFRSARDIRTLVDLAHIPYNKEENKDNKLHNGLSDCIYQVKYCCECFKKLTEKDK